MRQEGKYCQTSCTVVHSSTHTVNARHSVIYMCRSAQYWTPAEVKVQRVRINWKMLCSRCRSLLASAGRRCSLPFSRSKTSKAKTINTDYFTPPTFGRLELADEAPLVSAYTTNGFVIRNNFVYGAVALLPRTLLNWKVFTQIRKTCTTAVLQILVPFLHAVFMFQVGLFWGLLFVHLLHVGDQSWTDDSRKLCTVLSHPAKDWWANCIMSPDWLMNWLSALIRSDSCWYWKSCRAPRSIALWSPQEKRPEHWNTGHSWVNLSL